MKILYKPKLLSVECTRCGCVFVPKRKHLTMMPNTDITDSVICPICRTTNYANFERQVKADDERSENGTRKAD